MKIISLQGKITSPLSLTCSTKKCLLLSFVWGLLRGPCLELRTWQMSPKVSTILIGLLLGHMLTLGDFLGRLWMSDALSHYYLLLHCSHMEILIHHCSWLLGKPNDFWNSVVESRTRVELLGIFFHSLSEESCLSTPSSLQMWFFFGSLVQGLTSYHFQLPDAFLRLIRKWTISYAVPFLVPKQNTCPPVSSYLVVQQEAHSN